MKHILFFIGILCFPFILQAQWYPAPMPTTQNFFSITFTDSLHGYIPVSNGPILQSSDGGVNWITVPTGTSNTLADICFPTASTGYSDGWNGVIVKTTNAGNTWSVINSPTTSVLRGICFLNPDTGFICGQFERIYRTTNGGTTWLQQNTGSWWLRQFSFPTKQTGYCVGDNLTIFKTTDGGLTWNQLPGSGGPNITDVQFLTVDTGFVCGYNGYVAKTFNGGQTWQILNTGNSINYEGLWFFNSMTGYCVGTPGIIMKTTDGGVTWTLETSSTTVTLEKLYFINPNKGYIAGFVGTLLENCLPAPGAVTGPTMVCQGDTGMTYSVNPVTGATGYQWHVPPGVIITSGSNTSTIKVTYSPSSVSGSFFVNAYNSFCDGSISPSLAVTVNPAPVPVITGNTSPLTGTTQTYSTQTGKSNYQWTFSPGGTLVSGGGVSNATITIQWTTAGAQWVRVSYTNATGCTALAPTQLDILVTNSVTIDFTAPDTVCVGEMITINDLTQGASTYYWNFCSGGANVNPTGINIGNPGGLLSIPTYLTLVKQHDSCFSFISCQGVGVVRYYHGTSFANNPVSWTNLGNFGLITFVEEGIQVKYDNGNWYGFVNDSITVIRLEFGNSLANTPTATNLGPFPSMQLAHGLVVAQEGPGWVGFITDSWGASLHRLTFGSSLANMPTFTDYGNVGGALPSPSGICLVQENSLWYAIVMAGNNTLARLTFGNSLMNAPTGVNLGNPGGFNSAIGITLLRDCETTTGYWVNYLVNGQLGKLTFPSGILGPVTGTLLGNIGGLARPHSFSEIFRQNDTLYAYITNRDNGTLTRLTFPPCNNASVPSSTQFNPPPFSYNQPGTYNIHLIADEGMITMASLCKPVVVMAPPSVNLGNDATFCPGDSVTLDAGPGFTGYLWSTGATTRSIKAFAAGTYWVSASRWGCTASDTITLSMLTAPTVNIGPDTSICSGQTITFNAGNCIACSYQWSNLTLGQMNIGTNQFYTTGTAGTYMVTVTGPDFCMTRDTVQLSVTPLTAVSLGITASANPVCAGTPVTFTAAPGNPGTSPVYLWKVNGIPSGTNSLFFTYTPLNGDQVLCILTSDVTCPSNNPAISNTIVMSVDPVLAVSVSISPSANPFCPGSSVTFTATPIHGGTTPHYLWKLNGLNAGTDNPTFTYNPANNDQVYCILTSSESCASGNPASSITITMIENTGLPAGVSITATPNPFCPGSSVTFHASPSNGGPTPSYLWKVNGINAGTNSDTYTYNPANGDSVRCIMTSNLACVTGSPTSSAKIIMLGTLAPLVFFTACFDTITRINAKPIKLKGGIPLGGTYSGPGVNSITSVFTPALAGLGTHTITYSYTNAALCTAAKSISLLNLPSSIPPCGDPITDPRDNKVYPTVQIGSQCWLATNLNFGTMLASSQDQRDNCFAEKYCYNDNPINCSNHGGLYQWDEVMRFDETPADQGICPPGWHIPSENDWNTLFVVYINNGFAGSPLKYSGYSGFNALLSGARHINKSWDLKGFATFFWSSTLTGDDKAWAHGMNEADPSVSIYPSSRVNAFSVRCLRD
jgi:uncharacterized protein (TIGR02145 family)